MTPTPKELKRFMKSHEWSARDVAARVPCTAHFIRLFLKGKTGMSDATAERIKSLTADSPVLERTKPTKGKS